jgi:hypothetical protein
MKIKQIRIKKNNGPNPKKTKLERLICEFKASHMKEEDAETN